MDNQITLIASVKLVRDEDYFLVKYLAKNKETGLYESNEMVCLHTKFTKSSADYVKNNSVILITGQLMQEKDTDNVVINPISYYTLEQKTFKKESSYLIKFGTDYNRIQLGQPLNDNMATHPVPPKGKIAFSGKLSKGNLMKLNIPIYSIQ